MSMYGFPGGGYTYNPPIPAQPVVDPAEAFENLRRRQKAAKEAEEVALAIAAERRERERVAANDKLNRPIYEAVARNNEAGRLSYDEMQKQGRAKKIKDEQEQYAANNQRLQELYRLDMEKRKYRPGQASPIY